MKNTDLVARYDSVIWEITQMIEQAETKTELAFLRHVIGNTLGSAVKVAETKMIMKEQYPQKEAPPEKEAESPKAEAAGKATSPQTIGTVERRRGRPPKVTTGKTPPMM